MNRSDLGLWCQMLWSRFICCCKMSPTLRLGSEIFAEELHHWGHERSSCSSGFEVLIRFNTPLCWGVFLPFKSCTLAAFYMQYLLLLLGCFEYIRTESNCVQLCFMSHYSLFVSYLFWCLRTTSRWHYIDESHLCYWEDLRVLIMLITHLSENVKQAT